MHVRAAWFVAMLALAAGCHSFYAVHGVVQSCSTRAPLADATVDLRYPGEHGRQKTEADGSFQVAVNDPPNDRAGTLTAAAPGYHPETRTVHDGDEVDICLDDQPAR